MSDTAAMDRFVQWEDEVERTAAELPTAGAKGSRKKGANGDESLLTLLAMEEQTRNSCFVAALQTVPLPKHTQGKALRSYVIMCDAMLNKLMRRLPTLPPDIAPQVSGYLSKVSQHRE